MPDTYRGRAEIKCSKAICVIDKARKDVIASCLECEFSEATMIDLEEKPLGALKKKQKANKKEVTEDGL